MIINKENMLYLGLIVAAVLWSILLGTPLK